MRFIKEFKDFISRGNVIDLAVGIIIGSAFGKIVASLVADIIMPPIGFLLGGVNFTDLKIMVKPAQVDAAGKITKAAVSINYGTFIQVCFEFLIIAFAVFLLIKVITSFRKKEEVAAAPTKTETLLEEIRDALKQKN
jgi:large conductance mechanosensitive channel